MHSKELLNNFIKETNCEVNEQFAIERLYGKAYTEYTENFYNSCNNAKRINDLDFNELFNLKDISSSLLSHLKTEAEYALLYGLVLFIEQTKNKEKNKEKKEEIDDFISNRSKSHKSRSSFLEQSNDVLSNENKESSNTNTTFTTKITKNESSLENGRSHALNNYQSSFIKEKKKFFRIIKADQSQLKMRKSIPNNLNEYMKLTVKRLDVESSEKTQLKDNLLSLTPIKEESNLFSPFQEEKGFFNECVKSPSKKTFFTFNPDGEEANAEEPIENLAVMEKISSLLNDGSYKSYKRVYRRIEDMLSRVQFKSIFLKNKEVKEEDYIKIILFKGKYTDLVLKKLPYSEFIADKELKYIK